MQGYRIINRSRGSRNRGRQKLVKGSFELSILKIIEYLQPQNVKINFAANKALNLTYTAAFNFVVVTTKSTASVMNYARFKLLKICISRRLKAEKVNRGRGYTSLNIYAR